jgi:peptidoglycan/LPS O-acetylase OafA/YrhL
LATPSLVNGALAPGYVLASYAFVPAARPDGIVQPLYSLGWTLNYEMVFYVLLATALRLPRRVAVGAVMVVLIALVLVVQIGGAPLPLSFWGDPIILEFGIGMLLGLARTDGLVLGHAARLGLGAVGLVLFLAVAALEPALPRALVFGLPAACLVAACGLGREHSFAEESWPVRLGAILGDASYALYLIHPFVLRGMRRAIQASGLSQAIGPWWLVAAGLCVAFAAAVLIYRFVERPLTSILRARLEPRRRPQPA